jgi:hypothetical protein
MFDRLSVCVYLRWKPRLPPYVLLLVKSYTGEFHRSLSARLNFYFQLERKYSMVSFCYGSFYDDSLLRPLPNRTEHSRLVVHHCRKSSIISLLSAFPALFRCACAYSFSCFSAALLSVLWFIHPWRSTKRQIVLFCKKEWKEERRLTSETKILVIRKMEAGEKRKLKFYVVM